MKRTPLLITISIVSAALLGVCYIPLPHHIDCAFEIRPSEAGAMYAGTAGRIKEIRKQPGDPVEVDDVIVELENMDLRIRLADLQGEETVAKVKLAWRPSFCPPSRATSASGWTENRMISLVTASDPSQYGAPEARMMSASGLAPREWTPSCRGCRPTRVNHPVSLRSRSIRSACH